MILGKVARYRMLDKAQRTYLPDLSPVSIPFKNRGFKSSREFRIEDSIIANQQAANYLVLDGAGKPSRFVKTVLLPVVSGPTPMNRERFS